MFKFFKSFLNTGTYQTLLITLAGASAALAGILEKIGCTVSTSGVTTCLPSDAPFWFPNSMEPYLIPIASAATALAVVIRFMKGTAATPSAPISESGDIGTVTQKQVDTVSSTVEKPKVNKPFIDTSRRK
jgi:hypothetical protein